MTTTVQEFIDAGYKKFPNNGLNNSDYGLQKTLRSECGRYKKYFITVWVYDNARLGIKGFNKISFETDVNLFRLNPECEDGYEVIDIKFRHFTSVEHLESFYEEMWRYFGQVNDVWNND